MDFFETSTLSWGIAELGNFTNLSKKTKIKKKTFGKNTNLLGRIIIYVKLGCLKKHKSSLFNCFTS